MDDEVKVFYCDGCGGIMEFDIATQQMKCPNCGLEKDIPDSGKAVCEHDFSHIGFEKSDEEWNEQVEIIHCNNCGAEIVVDKNKTAVFCSFCGSSHVLESKQMAGIKPEGIIPFKIDKIKASEIFHKWIKSRWIAPNALKNLFEKDKMQAVYVPYWTYDANTRNTYFAQGGQIYYVTVGSGDNRHQEMRVRWYPVSGNFNKFFDDVLVSASKGNGNSFEKVENFNTMEVKPFETSYLSGFIAEKYSVEPKDGFEIAKNKIYQELHSDVEGYVLRRYDRCRVISINTTYSDIKYKHVLFPIWTAGYSFKGKVYVYVINGQSGRITGEYPKSPVKIALIVLAVILVVFIFYMIYNGNV